MKIINRILYILYVGLGLYIFISRFETAGIYKSLIALAVIPIILVPYVVKKVFKYELSDTLVFLYLIFIFLALFLGSVFGFYLTVDWFDLFVHGLSGIITALVAIIILKKKKMLTKEHTVFNIIFIISFVLAIASIWEFWEFICDKFSGKDAQHVIESGVDDTMTDMLSAFVGSIIMSVIYTINACKTKKNQELSISKFV